MDDWRTRVSEGNAFDEKVFDDFNRSVCRDGGRDIVNQEVGLITTTGRRGRMDIFVKIDRSTRAVAIIENKATNWNGLTDQKIERRVARHAAQIWRYIEPQLGRIIAPGVMVRKRPEKLCEAKATFLDDRRKGIMTIWAIYSRLRLRDEVWVTSDIVVVRRPRNDRRADEIVDHYREHGASVVWSADLEREVYAGITFKRRPADQTKMMMIDDLYGQYGITVVWDDESIMEQRVRKRRQEPSARALSDSSDHETVAQPGAQS